MPPSTSQAAEKTQQLAEHWGERHGMDKEQAFRFLGSAALGTPLGGLIGSQAKVEGNYASTAKFQDAYEDAKTFAESSGFKEAYSQIDGFRVNTTSNEGYGSTERGTHGQTTSFSEVQQAAKQYQASLQEAESYQRLVKQLEQRSLGTENKLDGEIMDALVGAYGQQGAVTRLAMAYGSVGAQDERMAARTEINEVIDGVRDQLRAEMEVSGRIPTVDKDPDELRLAALSGMDEVHGSGMADAQTLVGHGRANVLSLQDDSKTNPDDPQGHRYLMTESHKAEVRGVMDAQSQESRMIDGQTQALGERVQDNVEAWRERGESTGGLMASTGEQLVHNFGKAGAEAHEWIQTKFGDGSPQNPPPDEWGSIIKEGKDLYGNAVDQTSRAIESAADWWKGRN